MLPSPSLFSDPLPCSLSDSIQLYHLLTCSRPHSSVPCPSCQSSPLLFYSVISCLVLFNFILFSIVLSYSLFVLFCSRLFCPIPFCSTLFFPFISCCLLFSLILSWSVLFSPGIYYSLLFSPILSCSLLFSPGLSYFLLPALPVSLFSSFVSSILSCYRPLSPVLFSPLLSSSHLSSILLSSPIQVLSNAVLTTHASIKLVLTETDHKSHEVGTTFSSRCNILRKFPTVSVWLLEHLTCKFLRFYRSDYIHCECRLLTPLFAEYIHVHRAYM